MPHVYKPPNAGLAKGEHGVRRPRLELAQEGHGRNTGKLPDQQGDPGRERSRTTDGHEYGVYVP
jgi:hypothetical protein